MRNSLEEEIKDVVLGGKRPFITAVRARVSEVASLDAPGSTETKRRDLGFPPIGCLRGY